LAQINPRVYNDKNTLDFRGDMSQMTLGNVLPVLARHISTTFALQITDPQYPDYGGILNPDWGLAEEYLQRVQRPSGLIDLHDCNY
jgi:hypothetical protein